jgi:hypothetical protein
MVAINCPACNKTGVTTESCPRCGCDLSRLHTIQRAALWHLGHSARLLQEKEWVLALHYAGQSWRLRHTSHAAGLAFLAASTHGDTILAAIWHDRAKIT